MATEAREWLGHHLRVVLRLGLTSHVWRDRVLGVAPEGAHHTASQRGCGERRSESRLGVVHRVTWESLAVSMMDCHHADPVTIPSINENPTSKLFGEMWLEPELSKRSRLGTTYENSI